MDAFEQLVSAIRRAGEELWPGIEVDERSLRGFLAQGAIEGATPSHLADLYLVAGCVAGQPRAFEAFERSQMPVVERTVRAMGGAADLVEEIKQHVRTVALLGRAGRPSVLATYSGTGPLGSWVRVIAMREAMRRLRAMRARPPAGDDELFALVAAHPDPELEMMQATYREELRNAFHAAVVRLPRRERTALRLSVLDGLSIDAIAALYRVHRATAARWLAGARGRLIRETRAALFARLRLPGGEIDSILRLVGSRLDISIATALDQE